MQIDDDVKPLSSKLSKFNFVDSESRLDNIEVDEETEISIN